MTPSTPSGRRLAYELGVEGYDAPALEMIVDVEREAVEAYRLSLAEKVRASQTTVTMHTCWDDHEGPGGTHLDGRPCNDKPRESIDRAAVIRLIEGEKTP